MAVRNYTNLAPPLALSVRAESNSTVLTVSSTAGYPTAPFLLAMERGTGNEEVCLCTASTATTFTVTRGFDGTTPKIHEIGTAVEHTVAAIDFREANLHVNDSDSNHAIVGEIKMWPVDTLPTGRFIWARGQFISKATYSDLWALYQNNFLDGQPAQTDNFRVPDGQRRFFMGKAASGYGSTLGGSGGSADATLVSHSHGGVTSGGNTGGHTHTTDAQTHSHAVTGDGSHWHYASAEGEAVLVIRSPTGPYNDAGPGGDASTWVTHDVGHTVKTSSAGHSHGVSGDGNHAHTVNSTNSPHSHPIAAEGASGVNANMPPWQAINFIIRY